MATNVMAHPPVGGPTYLYHENLYLLNPDGTLERLFDGRAAGFQNLDACD